MGRALAKGRGILFKCGVLIFLILLIVKEIYTILWRISFCAFAAYVLQLPQVQTFLLVKLSQMWKIFSQS